MDCLTMFLHERKSISYCYDAYISPTNHYPIVKDAEGNEYVVLDIPQAEQGSTRAEVYLNWIDDGNDDFVQARVIDTYAPLIELVECVEGRLPWSELLLRHGLLETNDTMSSEKYIHDGWCYQPWWGFDYQYVKQKMYSIYWKYQSWLSFINTGRVSEQLKVFSFACGRYKNLVSIDEQGHVQEQRLCQSWLDLVESQLGDLYLLGKKVLDDQSIFRCHACGEMFIGAFNKNKRLCPQCDTPAAKQKRYRTRLKEAAHANENHS